MSKDVIESIVDKINDRYNGLLVCETQRADLFVYVDGEEEVIKSIYNKGIHFYNTNLDCDFYDTDIATLVYIDKCI